jgi:hypothetical protein
VAAAAGDVASSGEGSPDENDAGENNADGDGEDDDEGPAERTVPDAALLDGLLARLAQADAGGGEVADTAPHETAAEADEPVAGALTSVETMIRLRSAKPDGPEPATGPPTAATMRAPRQQPATQAKPDKDAWWANAYQAERKRGTSYTGSRPDGQHAQPSGYSPPRWPGEPQTTPQPSYPDEYPPAGKQVANGRGGAGQDATRPGRGGQRGAGRSRRRALLAITSLVVVAAVVAVVVTLLTRKGGGSPNSGTTSPGASVSPVAAVGSVPPATKQTPSVVNYFNTPKSGVPDGFTQARFTPAQTGTTAGFTIDYPTGWQVSQAKGEPQRVYFKDPDSETSVEVDLTAHTKPEMLAEAQYVKQQSQAKGSFTSGYDQLELDAQGVRGTRGAVWRFDYKDSNGVLLRADDLLCILPTANGGQSYAFFATAPEGPGGDTWDKVALPIVDQMLASFQPTTT